MVLSIRWKALIFMNVYFEYLTKKTVSPSSRSKDDMFQMQFPCSDLHQYLHMY